MAGLEIEDAMERIDARIIVECGPPETVMENLKMWHTMGLGVVVGTSCFY